MGPPLGLYARASEFGGLLKISDEFRDKSSDLLLSTVDEEGEPRNCMLLPRVRLVFVPLVLADVTASLLLAVAPLVLLLLAGGG